MSRRVVLDNSTLVSAALRVGSVPHQALVAALGAWDVCASSETLAELERVLEHRKFDRYLDCALREEFVAVIRRSVHLVSVRDEDVRAVDPPCRDPKDNQFLAVAFVAGAEVIVSSDEDLLVLNPWCGIAVVTAGEFLARFGR